MTLLFIRKNAGHCLIDILGSGLENAMLYFGPFSYTVQLSVREKMHKTLLYALQQSHSLKILYTYIMSHFYFGKIHRHTIVIVIMSLVIILLYY